MSVARVKTRRQVRSAIGRAQFLVARADHDAFGELLALAEIGRVRFAGERYDRRGERLAAFEVKRTGRGQRASSKGSIRIGQEFFSLALRDYRDWKAMWWREAIQNAVDAKAKEVLCSVAIANQGHWVSCEDNGKGMSEDVLLNKFLVLGATTKKAEQQAVTMRGGFGKAKELLILPWIEWRIRSRGVEVRGAGIDYTVRRGLPHKEGTRISVLMPADNATTEVLALNYIKKCNLPKVKFHMGVWGPTEADIVRADLKPGRKIREFRGSGGVVLLATLHHFKKENAVPQRLLVRAQGLQMFGMWVSSDVPGQLILELKAPSVELLTANRDGFSDRTPLRRSVEHYVNDLAADISSSLKRKTGLVRRKYYGEGGRFAATDRSKYTKAILEDRLGDLEPEGRGGTMSKGQLDDMGRALAKALGAREIKETTIIGQPASVGLARVMMGGIPVGGSTRVEAALGQLSWEPDFFLVNEIEDFRVPKRFTPEGMTGPVRQVARLWTELCRFVLIQLGCRAHFGVGFVFSDSSLAEFIHEDGENWLMLNPMWSAQKVSEAEIGRYGVSFDPWAHLTEKGKRAPLYSLSKVEDIRQLYALAVHECTHLSNDISLHNEAFAAALTINMRKTMDRGKWVKEIVKAIKGEEKAAKVKAKQKKKGPRTQELWSPKEARSYLKLAQGYTRTGSAEGLQTLTQNLVWAHLSNPGNYGGPIDPEVAKTIRSQEDVRWIIDQDRRPAHWADTYHLPVIALKVGDWVFTRFRWPGDPDTGHRIEKEWFRLSPGTGRPDMMPPAELAAMLVATLVHGGRVAGSQDYWRWDGKPDDMWL